MYDVTQMHASVATNADFSEALFVESSHRGVMSQAEKTITVSIRELCSVVEAGWHFAGLEKRQACGWSPTQLETVRLKGGAMRCTSSIIIAETLVTRRQDLLPPLPVT